MRLAIPTLLLACAYGSTSALAADLRIVGVDDATLQEAVDAASDGDTIVIDASFTVPHEATITGKSLRIVGRPGDLPFVTGLVIDGLPSGGFVTVSGVTGFPSSSGDAWIRANDCLGTILIDRVSAASSRQTVLSITNCADVIVRRSRMVGTTEQSPTAPPLVRVSNSRLTVDGSVLVGAPGFTGASGLICTNGDEGGTTLDLDHGSIVRVSSSVLEGGPGGWGGQTAFGSCFDGPRGPAADLDSSSSITLVGTEREGPLVGGGAVLELQDESRSFELPDFALSREDVPLAATGAPGEQVVLLVGRSLAFRELPEPVGVLQVSVAGLERRVVGTIPPSGTLESTTLTPAVPAVGLEVYVVQPAYVLPSGAVRLGAARELLVLGREGPIRTNGHPTFVDANAAPDGDGSSWSHAENDIDRACRRSWTRLGMPGPTVWVASGTYVPPAQDQRVGVPPGTRVLGGFLPGMTDEAERDPDLHRTVLTADLARDDLPGDINRSDNGWVLAELRGGWLEFDPADAPQTRVSTAVLSGFDLRGVDYRNHPSSQGPSAIVMEDSATLERCRITDNRTVFFGYLIRMDGSSVPGILRLDRVHAWANVGGLLNSFAPVGMRTELAGLLVHDCVATRWLVVLSRSATIDSSTFANNAVDAGRALAFLNPFAGESIEVRNSIFWENTSGGSTGFDAQFVLAGDADPSAMDFRFDRNLIQGWPTVPLAGEGNSGADPEFVDPLGADGVPGSIDDDYRLPSGSPGVDSGDSSLVPAFLTSDLDGAPRIADDPATLDSGPGAPPHVDRGAYERQP